MVEVLKESVVVAVGYRAALGPMQWLKLRDPAGDSVTEVAVGPVAGLCVGARVFWRGIPAVTVRSSDKPSARELVIHPCGEVVRVDAPRN
jgi:hypothetical protein